MSYVVLFLSVFLGSALVFFYKPNDKALRLLLAFSGAYLLAITILHLLPEVYENSASFERTGYFILFGILLQFVLESFSKGIEHGHSHLKGKKGTFHLLFFGSLCLHAFLEGIPVESSNSSLLWAIAVHKLPIAIVLTTFFIQKELSKPVIIGAVFFFGAMSPLGTLLGSQTEMLKDYIYDFSAIAIGIFLHISTIILFESSENHKFNIRKFVVIILGFVISFLSL